MGARRRLWRIGLLAGLLVGSSALSGCILGAEPLIVAASAPKASDGMTLFVVTETGFLEKARGHTHAEYVVYFGDRLIYPPAGRGASFPVEGRSGSVFVPYDLFVVGNGEYDVLVKFAGVETRARVHVEKWVEYVYLHPFDRGDTIVVEVALSSAAGGRPEDRILSRGELVLNLKYRGLDGSLERNVGQVTAETRHDATSTSVSIPRSRFNAGPGYYSVEPLFHNYEARDNVQVGADPTMANMRPPYNWIYISP